METNRVVAGFVALVLFFVTMRLIDARKGLVVVLDHGDRDDAARTTAQGIGRDCR